MRFKASFWLLQTLTDREIQSLDDRSALSSADQENNINNSHLLSITWRLVRWHLITADRLPQSWRIRSYEQQEASEGKLWWNIRFEFSPSFLTSDLTSSFTWTFWRMCDITDVLNSCLTLSLRRTAATLLCRQSHRWFPSWTISRSLQEALVRFSRDRRRYCLLINSKWVSRSWTCRWNTCETKQCQENQRPAKDSIKSWNCQLLKDKMAVNPSSKHFLLCILPK